MLPLMTFAWASALIAPPWSMRNIYALPRPIVMDQSTAILSWRQNSTPEAVVPTVSLTRSRDQSTGTATFKFDSPAVLSKDDIWINGLVTGLWLRDDEGELVSTDLTVDFVQGQPAVLTAILVLKSAAEWERFMRFMRRYADANELAFESARDG